MFGIEQEAWRIFLLTLYVAAASTAISALIGIPLGALLGLHESRLRRLFRIFTHTMYGVPSVIVGLLVYMLLSRAGPLGALGILFTPSAMIVAQVFLITPLIIGLTASAVLAVPKETKETALSLGASKSQLVLAVINESRIGMLNAIMVGFGRGVSEVGAAILVGGNIRWFTRVLTTAILLETEKGNFQFALMLGALLFLLSLSVSLIITVLQRSDKK